MLEILHIGYDDLTEEEKEDQPDNGGGKEYAGYIRVIHDFKTVAIHSDAMEPEDVTFGRDLAWVIEAMKDAYTLGHIDKI